MKSNHRILVVDDEEDILEFLSYNLLKENYTVNTASNGEEAVSSANDQIPDLILLDIMMPEKDGIEVCKVLRADPKFDDTIIAFLTARGESFTQVNALDSGGDDFITKPITPSVLKSRIKALLRRSNKINQTDSPEILEYGDLIIDLNKYQVKKRDETIDLAKKEFELLTLLLSKPGKVFKRLEILSKVWGSDVIVGDRTIDVHIRKLREKIGSDLIKTIKGVGYKFND